MAYLWTRTLSNHEALDVEAFLRGSGPRPACLTTADFVPVENAHPTVGLCDGARVLNGNVTGIGWNVEGDYTKPSEPPWGVAVDFTRNERVVMSGGEEVLRYPADKYASGIPALIAEVKRLRVLLAQRPEPDTRAQVVCDHGYDD